MLSSRLMRVSLFNAVLLLALSSPGAERKFDFSQFPENETPPGFRSTVWGLGKRGEWKVVMEDVPSALPALTPQAPSTSKRAVLAQLIDALSRRSQGADRARPQEQDLTRRGIS